MSHRSELRVARAGAWSKFNSLRAVQRMMALCVTRGFRTVATGTASVLAGVPPLALLVQIYSAQYHSRVELLRKSLKGIPLAETLEESKRQAL